MGIIFVFIIGAGAGAFATYWVNGMQTKGVFKDLIFKLQAGMDKRRKDRDG